MISIIIATFNSEATLKDTFDSILSQTYQDYELIVKDGASKDHTLDLIHEYELKFNGRMRWISEPDKGLYDAMNKGIEMSSGEIVGILNSDDFYTSDYILETINDSLKDQDVDAVYGDIHFVDKDDLNTCIRYYSSKIFKRSLMRLGFMPAHPSFYCRKKIYSEFGVFDTSFKIGADFENLLRLIYVNNIRIKYMPLDFVTMRIGGISTLGIKSRIQIMRDHIRAFKKNGVYSNMFILSFRYFYKIFEVLNSKLKH